MNDDELHESFYRSERYKETPTDRYARELAEAPRPEYEQRCEGCDGPFEAPEETSLCPECAALP